MKIIKEKITEYGELTGYLHEPSEEIRTPSGLPAILVLPGGRFRICSDREAEPVAMAYYAEGYQAFVLRYTTVTKKPDAVMEDPMQDVQEALRLIQERRREYQIAQNQIVMIGFSGGGHLAAASAVHGPLRPDRLILGYPGIVHSDLRALECPDIVESVDEHTPPAFLFSTATDTITPPMHPLTFAGALDRAGVGFELHIFREGDHGLSLAKPCTAGEDQKMMNVSVSQWFPLSIQWLKAELNL